MRSKRNLVLAARLSGFVLLLAVLGLGLRYDPRLLPSALIGKPLPDFQAERLDDPGQTVTPADLRGDIALLNIWATWCPTCRAEHEFLRALKRQGFTIYGMNYSLTRDKALRWLEALGDPYRLSIYDAEGRIGIDLGVYGAPETYLLDAAGVIRYRHVGELNQQTWEREILPRIEALTKAG